MAEISVEALSGQSTAIPARFFSYAGGALSLALIIGAAVWGTKLVMRDVSGIPMVQAAEGPVRIAPPKPGGDVAPNAGLSVNEVAADQPPASHVDQVSLAPQGVQLAVEDLTLSDNSGPVGAAPASAALAPLAPPPAGEEVQSLVDQILNNADAAPLSAVVEPAVAEAPVEDASAEDADTVVVMVNGSPVKTKRFTPPTSRLAVARAKRPLGRPAGLNVAIAPATPEIVTRGATSAPEIPQVSVPAGTPLVQLGAYDSASVAQKEWTRFSTRFADYMGGKTPVVQKAQSGGKTFYRLRAQGFADLSDARRFCSALMAQRTDCIPVVTR